MPGHTDADLLCLSLQNNYNQTREIYNTFPNLFPQLRVHLDDFDISWPRLRAILDTSSPFMTSRHFPHSYGALFIPLPQWLTSYLALTGSFKHWQATRWTNKTSIPILWYREPILCCWVGVSRRQWRRAVTMKLTGDFHTLLDIEKTQHAIIKSYISRMKLTHTQILISDWLGQPNYWAA